MKHLESLETILKVTMDLEEIEIQKVEALCPTKEALAVCLSFLNEYPEYDHLRVWMQNLLKSIQGKIQKQPVY